MMDIQRRHGRDLPMFMQIVFEAQKIQRGKEKELEK
jgi:hypothetical protein